eukprot:scaffold33222_cov129-Isochrysis_galbana.AAC.4
MPLALGLPLLKLVFPDDALSLRDALEHLGDARHHALQAAKVHVRAIVHAGEDLVRVFGDFVLDVHLAAVLVGLLTRERVVNAEVLRVRLKDRLPLVVVEQRVLVGHAEEEPGKAFVHLAVGRLLDEQAADEGAVGRDAGAGGDHDEVCGSVLLGDEHHLARRAVGAHALLGRVIGLELWAPIGGAAHAQRGGGTGHVVTVAR